MVTPRSTPSPGPVESSDFAGGDFVATQLKPAPLRLARKSQQQSDLPVKHRRSTEMVDQDFRTPSPWMPMGAKVIDRNMAAPEPPPSTRVTAPNLAPLVSKFGILDVMNGVSAAGLPRKRPRKSVRSINSSCSSIWQPPANEKPKTPEQATNPNQLGTLSKGSPINASPSTANSSRVSPRQQFCQAAAKSRKLARSKKGVSPSKPRKDTEEGMSYNDVVRSHISTED